MERLRLDMAQQLFIVIEKLRDGIRSVVAFGTHCIVIDAV